MEDSLTYSYSPGFFERLCPVLEEIIPAFDGKYFIFRVFNNDWPEMGSPQRTAHLAKVLRDFLPADFNRAATRIRRMAEALHKINGYIEAVRFPFLFAYIEMFGTDHMHESMSCLRYIGKIAGLANDPPRLLEETPV